MAWGIIKDSCVEQWTLQKAPFIEENSTVVAWPYQVVGWPYQTNEHIIGGGAKDKWGGFMTTIRVPWPEDKALKSVKAWGQNVILHLYHCQRTKTSKVQSSKGNISQPTHKYQKLRLRTEPSEWRSFWMSWGRLELRALTCTESIIHCPETQSKLRSHLRGHFEFYVHT